MIPLKRVAEAGLSLASAVLLGGVAYLALTASTPAAPLDQYLPPEETAAEAEAPRALVLMQLADCLASRALLQEWTAVHEAGEVWVQGVVVDGPFEAERLDDVLAKSGIRFPVEQDHGRDLTRFARSLGYRTTPILLIADTAGRIRLVSPLTEAPVRQVVAALTADGVAGP